MIPGYARPAHRRLRAKLDEIAAFGETTDLNRVTDGDPGLGIIVDGVSALHVARGGAGGAHAEARPREPAAARADARLRRAGWRGAW